MTYWNNLPLRDKCGLQGWLLQMDDRRRMFPISQEVNRVVWTNEAAQNKHLYNVLHIIMEAVVPDN